MSAASPVHVPPIPADPSTEPAGGLASSPVDLELVARLALGEVAAMAGLYERYAGLVNAVALRVTGHPGDAAEVVQEVFLQIWRQAASFDAGRGSVRGWICMIARTRALDLVRGRSRARASALEPGQEDRAAATDLEPQPSPELRLLFGESAREVRAAFQALSGVERRMLEMAFFEDMSRQEIADLTGLPLGTVKSHIARGLARLRRALADAGHPPDSGGG